MPIIPEAPRYGAAFRGISAAGSGWLVSGLLDRRHSIGVKMFGAFVAMGLMTLILGGYGLYVLGAAGGIVADTYDGPLMAINFARAASIDFAQMDNEALRRKLVPEAGRPAVDGQIDELSTTFFEDIAVADERAVGEREKATITQVREAVARWNALRRLPAASDGNSGEIDALARRILADFDTLIELTADRSFVQRRKAVSAISAFRASGLVLSGVTVLTGIVITLVLASRMIRPLRAAAKVADRIADGDLQAPIPLGGKDEIGAVLRSMTVMQDNIRETMQREVAQRQSAQSRLFDALEGSREGILLVDAAGRIVIANSQIADFFPSVASYIVGGADFAAAFAKVRPLLNAGGNLEGGSDILLERALVDTPFLVREYQIFDGRWVRFSRGETRDGGFFLSLIDFTEIKDREEHFKEAMKQADAANTAKSHFLTNMSHELRTPLNAIIGFSEIINGEMFGSVGNPQYREYAGHVLQSGRHLLDVINSVLDVAKSEAGKLELRSEVFDLGEVIRDCAVMMREMSERAQLRLHMPSLDAPLPVYGEPAKLRQIMLNLLSNAVKFNKPGGSVSLLAGAGEAGMTEFRVIDTGIGMSPGDIAVALTPFGQVDSRLARRYEGTGLGLPLTKALVELHGGAMTIESSPGQGTVVTVAIPRSA